MAAFLSQQEPFASSASYSLMAVWNESVDVGLSDPDRGVKKNTLYQASYGIGAMRRAVVANRSAVQKVASNHYFGNAAAVVLIKGTERGGACLLGPTPNIVTTVATGDFCQVVLHELGHALFELADEYERLGSLPDGRDRWGVNSPDAFLDPLPANLSDDPQAPEWAALHNTTKLPTLTHAPVSCSTPDNRQHSGLLANVVGAFEGGGYYRCGLYRSQLNCMMRDAVSPFCVRCAALAEEVLA